jgi:hypothetical protein
MRLLRLLVVVIVAQGATASASTLARQPALAGVLVAPRYGFGSLSDAGLLLVSPNGAVREMLPARWTAVAVGGPNGPFAVERRGPLSERRPLLIVDGSRATEIPDSVDARCVAWSADRQRLTFLTGVITLFPGSATGRPVFTIAGSLWVVEQSAPSTPRAVASGVFPLTECPSWAPSGNMLAYVLRTASGWQLTVSRDGRTQTVASRETVSVGHRTFDWRGGGRLVFLDDDSLFEWTGGATVRLTQEHALATVGDSAVHFSQSLRTGPNQRLIAVSIGGETAVVTSLGHILRKVPGALNGWAGNSGVLTLHGEPRGVILRLYRITSREPGRVIAVHFKSGTVSDAGARWFAYNLDQHNTIYFRRLNGSLLRRVHFGRYVPWVFAGLTASGRVIEPISAY